MTKPLAFSLVLLLLLAPIAGCLGEDGEPAVEPASEEGTSEGDEEEWETNLSGGAEYLLARSHDVGPASGISWFSGCGLFTFEMPEDTDEAVFGVSGPAINESRPGAGYGTFKVKHDDEGPYRDPPSNDRPQETRNITVEEPMPGEWYVWVWPWWLAVNQYFDVEVHLSGTGPAPSGELALEPSCGDDRVAGMPLEEALAAPE